MRTYSNIISLTKNSRGIYSLDPTMGCASGTEHDKRGCFSDCYAERISRIYGYDFTKTVKRDFVNKSHLEYVKRQVAKIPLPFVRMGTMGDPSEDWSHTLNICKKLQSTNQLTIFNEPPKQIVIITKHWNKLTEHQLSELLRLNICINTSTSAVDNRIEDMLYEYNRIKPYCKSILRVVTFDFNQANTKGYEYNAVQKSLLKHPVLETVFRASKSNQMVKDGIIKVKKTKFLGKPATLSKRNPKAYVGFCGSCKEMCGVKM